MCSLTGIIKGNSSALPNFRNCPQITEKSTALAVIEKPDKTTITMII